MTDNKKQNTAQIDVLGNIYNNILKGLSLGKTLIMAQGSARSGKSRNIVIFLCLRCLEKTTKVSVVRRSLPTIKRSILEDFKIVMQQMGQWEDRRFNKTDFVYYFPNGSIMEFFSAEDEQKLRGPSRDILYANEANEISYYAFSNLRMRTYEFCIVDYNPTFTEEHWLFPLMTDERTYYFKSTFMDNIFLPQAARDEILSYKETNPAIWKIYGEGEFAIIDGLVFPKENWDIIPDDDFPTWLGEEFLGLDWGFTCFSGDTLIMTRDGNKPIKDIKAGDYVLTRCGFRKVIASLNKGVKDVTEREFTICGKTIKFVATDNHKFYANGKWKKYEALTKKDKLCVLSSLTGGVTNGTQMANTPITISTSGKKMVNTIVEDCIGTFGSPSMEKSRKGKTFTTKTGTLLTTILVICNWLLIASMQKFTTILNDIINCTPNTARKFDTLKKIGVRAGLLLLKGCKAIQRRANGAGRRLSQQMYISDFAEKNATINGNINRPTTLLRQNVQYVVSSFCKTSISNSNVAQKNVHISYQEISDMELLGKSKQLVYDLSVEGCHEYFANGVLVHNCDPTVCVGVIVNDTDIYVREYFREVGLKTKDIAKMLEPYKDLYKYCDIDNRLVSELEDAGVPLLTMTHKNSESIMSGIRLMNQRHIHITASSTDTIKEFRNYVYKKDRQDVYQTNLRPIDKFNHCFTGDTLIQTANGETRIDSVHIGDIVYTSDGLRKVEKVFHNGVQEVWDIIITCTSGEEIRLSVTPTHKVKTNKIWKPIQEIKKGDVIYLFNYSMGKNITYTTGKDTFHEAVKECTWRCGSSTMGKSPKATTFTIKMKIHGITLLRILSCSILMCIYHCMPKNIRRKMEQLRSCEVEWTTQENMPMNGTEVNRGEHGTESMQERISRQCKRKNMFAKIAGKLIWLSPRAATNFVAITASRHGVEKHILTKKQESAKNVGENLLPAGSARQNVAVGHVVKDFRIVRKCYENTYNLMINTTHEYFANGLLVSNCIDAIRYVVYAECNGRSNDDTRGFSKEELGIFM